MDGMHDIGGMQGFGPVPVEETDANDPPNRYDWEMRIWAMVRAGVAQGITIDWFRHAIERMVPRDYMNFRYFNKWCTSYLALLVDNGAITLEEAVEGRAKEKAPPATPMNVHDVLERNKAMHISFVTETPDKPAYAVGDQVQTKRRIDADHTRLPRYAASATGVVTAHHGPHALPDLGAKGEHVGQHLYTVEFTARELWGDKADPRDTIRLELWESYLVRA